MFIFPEQVFFPPHFLAHKVLNGLGTLHLRDTLADFRLLSTFYLVDTLNSPEWWRA